MLCPSHCGNRDPAGAQQSCGHWRSPSWCWMEMRTILQSRKESKGANEVKRRDVFNSMQLVFLTRLLGIPARSYDDPTRKQTSRLHFGCKAQQCEEWILRIIINDDIPHVCVFKRKGLDIYKHHFPYKSSISFELQTMRHPIHSIGHTLSHRAAATLTRNNQWRHSLK